jgi:hypothetical protein
MLVLFQLNAPICLPQSKTSTFGFPAAKSISLQKDTAVSFQIPAIGGLRQIFDLKRL